MSAAAKIDLRRMSAAELLRLQRDAKYQLAEAKKDKLRNVSAPNFSSPKDPLVQRLAAESLRDMHDNEDMSFEEIGQIYGVTRERVRQIYNSLCV